MIGFFGSGWISLHASEISPITKFCIAYPEVIVVSSSTRAVNAIHLRDRMVDTSSTLVVISWTVVSSSLYSSPSCGWQCHPYPQLQRLSSGFDGIWAFSFLNTAFLTSAGRLRSPKPCRSNTKHEDNIVTFCKRWHQQEWRIRLPAPAHRMLWKLDRNSLGVWKWVLGFSLFIVMQNFWIKIFSKAWYLNQNFQNPLSKSCLNFFVCSTHTTRFSKSIFEKKIFFPIFENLHKKWTSAEKLKSAILASGSKISRREVDLKFRSRFAIGSMCLIVWDTVTSF